MSAIQVWKNANPQFRMVSDMHIPWLKLQDDHVDNAWTGFEDDEDEDAIGSPDLDVEALVLTDDVNSTMPVDAGTVSGGERVEKRKRTASQATPTKVSDICTSCYPCIQLP
jgi:hypothetical protein